MINILWADDEINLLKPHIIYLEGKGYNVVSAKSGDEALELLRSNNFDLIFSMNKFLSKASIPDLSEPVIG